MGDRIAINREVNCFILAVWPARQKLVKIDLDQMWPAEP